MKSGESPLRKVNYSATHQNSRRARSIAAQVESPNLRYAERAPGRCRPSYSRLLLRSISKETDDRDRSAGELPGLEARICIETDGRRLILRGQKKEESEERGRPLLLCERRFGAFTRVIDLACRWTRARRARPIGTGFSGSSSESAGGKRAAAKSNQSTGARSGLKLANG